MSDFPEAVDAVVSELAEDILLCVRGYDVSEALPALAAVLCCMAQGCASENGETISREEFLSALGGTWDDQKRVRENASLLVCKGCAQPDEQAPGVIYDVDIRDGVCARCEAPLTLDNVLRIHPDAPIN